MAETESTNPLELALKKCETMAEDIDATVALLTMASAPCHPDRRHRMVTSRALGSVLCMRGELSSLLEYAT